MTDIENALIEWKQLEIVDTWDLPADHPAYLAKCAAYARYMALALAPVTKTPQTPLLMAGEGTPEILATPASRALSVKAVETSPLRLVQVGSNDYWNGLAEKRARQHAAAKARVEAKLRGVK